MPVLTTLTASLAIAGPSPDPLLAPDLLARDVPVVVEVLGASDDQSAIIASLLEDYLAEAAAAADASRLQLAALDAGHLHANWTPRDWSDQHRAWSRIRAAATSMDDPAEAAAWLAGQQDWARRELASLVDRLPAAPPSARTDLLRAAVADRRARHAALQRDIALVLEADRGRWAGVEQAIRRDRSPFRGGLPGESLDLEVLVREAIRDVPGQWATLRPLLLAYERDWSTAVAARDALLEDQLPLVLDAVDRRDHLARVALQAAEVTARKRVVQVNSDWYDRLSAELPSEVVNDFQRSVNRAWYPDIFAPSRAERTVAYFLSDPEVSDQLRSALVRSRIKFGGPRLRLAAEERTARRVATGRARTARAEQRAMAEVFGPTALFRMSDSPADRSLSRAAALATRRRAMDVAWLQHLQGLLGGERWASVPDEVRIEPSSPADLPRGDDGKPLAVRVMP